MKFSLTKNPQSEFLYKESKSNKKKKFWQVGGKGWGVARVSDFFFFLQYQVGKKIVFFFFF